MTYETVLGESIAVLGSIPELGGWDKEKIMHHLKWTEGHKWVSEVPIVTTESFFRYKYIICHDLKFKDYERGIDKVAELKISQTSSDGIIHFDNVWQEYQLKFSVFSHEGDDENMFLDYVYQGEK